jgi:putative membrane protein
MKNLCNCRKVLIYITFLAPVLLITSCDTRNKNEDPKEIAEDKNKATLDNRKDEKDAQFLVNAAEINLKEIQLGQLAQQSGTAADVKELGRMMENAHSKSLQDLSALAQRKMITIPTSPTDKGQEAYRDLADKTGNDFDKAYANKMVDDHKESIDLFEKVSKEAVDVDIRNWATASLPELRKHLDHAMECQKKL